MFTHSPALRHIRANSGITFRHGANTKVWYPGQDDPQSSTIRDRSGEGNDGTLVGTTWKRLGTGLWVNRFDGTDDVITVTLANNVAPPFTLNIWAKFDAENAANMMIMDGGADVQAALFNINNTDIRFNNGAEIALLAEAVTNWQMYTIIVDGASSSIRSNAGTPVEGALNATTLTGLRLGERGSGISDFLGESALCLIEAGAVAATVIAGWYREQRGLFGV